MLTENKNILFKKLLDLTQDGLRSVGEWSIVKNINDIKIESANLNEFQIKHANVCIEKENCFILMKEKYNSKYRIHSLYSFASNMMTQIFGSNSKIVGDYTENEKKIEEICLEILGYKKDSLCNCKIG